jgi:hypothetical protein
MPRNYLLIYDFGCVIKFIDERLVFPFLVGLLMIEHGKVKINLRNFGMICAEGFRVNMPE